MSAEEIRRIAEREKLKCSFVTRTLGHPDGIVLDCTVEIRNALLAFAAMVVHNKVPRNRGGRIK